MWKKFGNFFERLTDVSNPTSSKSFSLLMSTLTGALIALCICFVLIFDVCTNGYVKTDLMDLGMFLLCIGVYITGSSIPKIFAQKFDGKYGKAD